jgi:hypothetical protein
MGTRFFNSTVFGSAKKALDSIGNQIAAAPVSPVQCRRRHA